MDMETVMPFKTVNDIVKEVNETELIPLAKEKECSCGPCNCGGDI